MPVTDTSLREEMLDHVNAAAKDEVGAYITVVATREAIQDHGWPAIFQAASAKYDRNEIETVAGARLIRVGSHDCLPDV